MYHEHDSRFQESSLRARQISDAAIKGRISSEERGFQESELWGVAISGRVTTASDETPIRDKEPLTVPATDEL
ncbi:hypothetical protein J6590_011577 [Homalodisca vitripennis]|nr:hypothetical protein J6590_011577 [Homalodisca vitripennis]